MPPKRRAEPGEEETSSREKKKQKIAVARTIAVQPVKAVSFLDNAEAGPSSQSKTINSMQRLPSAIDVERFAEARAYEIDAMHNAMKAASASSTHRVWQTLPRHLRRRAASHDVRRVPLRLREKARAEMDPVRRKALGRSMPKRGKSKSLTRTESFLRRQNDKTWLETHIWHAKRMKMENMWGYRLAVHPTEKAFRPSHRASIHGSIIHDASYYSLIELKGPEQILKTILETCCDPQGPSPGAKRYSVGSRALETHIYKPKSYPFNLIGPTSIIWRPLVTLPTSIIESEVTKENSETQKGPPKRKRKKKTKDPAVSVISTHPDTHRAVWLRSHPSIADEVSSSLQNAAALTLEDIKRNSAPEDSDIEVEIADLTGQVNVFEIMGPKSSQVLKGALSPVTQDSREDFSKFWSSLTDLQTSGSVPRGMIIGFKVIDPRLKFPPKNARPKPPSPDNVPTTITVFPSPSLAQTEIWDESIRSGLAKPRYKKKDLDERRSKNPIPGTPLGVLRQDNRIPVMLIQRSLENSGSDSQSIHGWTLIIPAGWSMAFFSSLTFTGTRVGGQRERQTQSFEAGTVYFPRDYPSSMGYDSYIILRAKEEQTKWEKKPPAKRPNFEKLGTRYPWKTNWESILGLSEAIGTQEGTEQEGEFVTTQRDTVIVDERPIGTWLLRGSEVSSIISRISKLFNHQAGLLDEINRLRLKRGYELMNTDIKAEDLLKAALVSIRIKVCKRGAPEDLALIYSLEDNEVRKWEKILQKHKTAGFSPSGEETPDETELSENRPPESSIIGSITTGHFSLSQGEGFAIGAIPLVQFLELQEQNHRLHPTVTPSPSSFLVKIRNGNSQQCRVAHLELLESEA